MEIHATCAMPFPGWGAHFTGQHQRPELLVMLIARCSLQMARARQPGCGLEAGQVAGRGGHRLLDDGLCSRGHPVCELQPGKLARPGVQLPVVPAVGVTGAVLHAPAHG